MNRFPSVVWLLLLLCCATAHPALADRRHVPMGDNVRTAAVVALADTLPDKDNPRNIVLALREILKGDAGLAGQQVTVPLSRSTADIRLPREARGIAALLPENWQTAERPLLEVYQKPEEIAALRVFVAVYKLPSERARLLALQERLNDPNPLFGKQLFLDLAGMREAGNFELLTNLFAKGGEATQREVVALIGRIGDKRGVPTLIAALDSPYRGVTVEAANALCFYFRGAPGVTAAFRRILQQEQSQPLHVAAQSYLMAYDPTLAAQFEAKRNAYQRASELLQRGDEAGARPLFDLILTDPEQTEAIIRFNTHWVVRSIEERPGGQETIRRALLPVLARYAREDNYSHAASAAKVLSALRHPDSVAPLLDLLSKSGKPLYDESTRIAAFALADMGPQTRQQALERLSTHKGSLELGRFFEKSADEVQTLITSLANANVGKSRLPPDWTIYRLGELRDERAIEPLFQDLTDNPWSNGYITTEALIRIGGPQVEAAALRLLNHPDENWVRRQATEIVFRLQGRRALPLVRRMITEPNFGLKSSALLYLGRHGTPEDLELLIPLSDFWTGDRENHPWLMSAVSQIRDRHNLDLTGPIQKPG